MFNQQILKQLQAPPTGNGNIRVVTAVAILIAITLAFI